jgi:hypothetical protein
MQPEMMECNGGRSLVVPGAKGKNPAFKATQEEIAPGLLSTYLYLYFCHYFFSLSGRAAAGTFVNTEPAKPLRLKVRLAPGWNVGIKNGMVDTNDTSPLVGRNRLKQTIM